MKRISRDLKNCLLSIVSGSLSLTDNKADARVMIIDNIGMLSSAYRYAYIAEVGGGFGKGIHNVLEPACWGIPVLFGPEHLKFREAVDLIAAGGAVSFKDYSEFEGILNNWLSDEKLYRKLQNRQEHLLIKIVARQPK